MEGENITLSGMTSRETEGDKLTLTYQWDSDHIDGDLDGVKTGDVDFTGPMYTIEDLPAGQWTVQLTVIDDDGESSTDTIQLTVTERPPDNWIESVSNTIGTVPTAIIGALGIIVVLLAGFLLLTRRKGNSEMENFSNFASMPAGEPPAPAINATVSQPMDYAAPAPQQDIYSQAAYAPPAATQEQAFAPAQPYATAPATKEDPFAALVDPTPAPAAPAPVQTGPPLPATGLPEGWSMEQWNHYGAQYLSAQQGQPAAIQPVTTDTTPASQPSNISGLLDDLDL